MDTKYYIDYYDLEREHWWFTARLNILESILTKKILTQYKLKGPINILNIGVATGATTEMLSKYGKVTSLEYDKNCCTFLFEKTGIKAINACVTDMPFPNHSYDLVCAFDVIEHVEDDNLAIHEINRVLKIGGYTFTTVPAFNTLWGDHDVLNHHFRRYKKRNYDYLFSTNHIETNYLNNFNFWLFVPIAIVRIFANVTKSGRKKTTITSTDNEGLNSNPLVGKILKAIFNSEEYLINNGIKLPFGVSIIHIGKKTQQ
jgi:ubiquinone/menaquinone biosynthesis C-methylase UbiE